MSADDTLSPDDADRFLVDEIRKGDARAWRTLIDRYQGRLSAFARSRVRADAEVDDIVQESFVGFLTSLKHYDATRSLETYLFAILRYKLGEYFTRRNRGLPQAAGFDPDGDAEPVEPAHGDTPSRVAVSNELEARQEALLAGLIRRLIRELREADKLDDVCVIELLFFVGLRNKEAAELLKRDEKAIAGVKFRALTRLRGMVDELRQAAGAEAALDGAALSNEATLARVWRRHRLTCPKRSTIGAYLLGVLDEAWQAFVEFHLERVACELCRANRDDLAAPAAERSGATPDQIFQSSVGFLSRTS